MKKILAISVLVIISFAACATGSKKNTNELRSVFDKYKLVSHKPDSVQMKYFTIKMWKELQESRQNPNNKTDQSILAVNNFPNEIVVKQSMEAIDNGKGCLIVQGNGRNGMPMDYNLVLTRSNSRWVFSDISVTLYDSGQKRWLTKPICDAEQKQLLWIKYLQKNPNLHR